MNEPQGPNPTPRESVASTAAVRPASSSVGSVTSVSVSKKSKKDSAETDSLRSSLTTANPDEEPKSKSKYAGSRWRQQNNPCWLAHINLFSLAWYLIPVGVILQILALVIYLGLDPPQSQFIPYTNCLSAEKKGQKCSEIILKDVEANCTCEVPFNVTSNFLGSVYLAFELTKYHQNQRQYIISVDDKQLKGKLFDEDCNHPIKPVASCTPFKRAKDNTSNKTKYIYPCGRFANSLFSDDVVEMTKSDESGPVPINWKQVDDPGTDEAKEIWYGDPLKQSPKCSEAEFKAKFTKPKQWSKPFWDNFLNEGGARSERFIIWMRPAAFPTFTVPSRYFHGSVKGCEAKMKGKGICKGLYKLKIQYRYNTVSFDGTKRIVLFQKHFVTDDTGFFFVASITIGTVCTCIGLVALIFFSMNKEAKKAGRRSQSIRLSNESVEVEVEDPIPTDEPDLAPKIEVKTSKPNTRGKVDQTI